MTHYLHKKKLFEIYLMPPKRKFMEGVHAFSERVESFHTYLSTLQPIPHELKGEGIKVEGKDFEWRYEIKNVSGNWKECEEWEHAGFDPDNRRRVAVPIEAKEGEKELDDKLKELGYNPEQLGKRGETLARLLIENVDLKRKLAQEEKNHLFTRFAWDKTCEERDALKAASLAAPQQTDKEAEKRLSVRFEGPFPVEERESWLAIMDIPGMVTEGATKSAAWEEMIKSLKVLIAFNSGISPQDLRSLDKSSQLTPIRPQQQAGREAVKENIENALHSTGQFTPSQCEQLAEIVMECIPIAPSSVSNESVLRSSLMNIAELIDTNYNPSLDTIRSIAKNALFTSQHGEQETQAVINAKLESEMIDILYDCNGTGAGAEDILNHLKQHYHITPKNKQ